MSLWYIEKNITKQELLYRSIGNVNQGSNVSNTQIDFNYAEQFQIAFIKAMAANVSFHDTRRTYTG